MSHWHGAGLLFGPCFYCQRNGTRPKESCSCSRLADTDRRQWSSRIPRTCFLLPKVHQWLCRCSCTIAPSVVKGSTFTWDTACQEAFDCLKTVLIQAPVLAFSDFNSSAAPFQLQTDASGVGVGAVLEQNGHVIAYASRVLSTAERNYSVIQRECLAVVYALKQFRHYWLRRHFIVLTDCSGFRPKRWKACLLVGPLSYRNSPSQFSIEGARITTMLILCHVSHPVFYWILLQQSPGLTETAFVKANIAEICTRLQTSSSCPTPSIWSGPPLSRYWQLWTQLSVVDGIVSCTYI